MLTCRTPRTTAPAAPSLREFDRLMNTMFRGMPSLLSSPEVIFSGRSGFGPSAAPLNVWEDEQNVYVETEVPGITMENLDIAFGAGELTIKGRRPQETPSEDVIFHRRERATAAEFSRAVRLGIPLDAEKVSASLNNGVLLVTLPKAEEARPRKITVSVK